ncbi:MAG: hypothetical protein ACRD3N_19190 [Terracidiphilus sp.]
MPSSAGPRDFPTELGIAPQPRKPLTPGAGQESGGFTQEQMKASWGRKQKDRGAFGIFFMDSLWGLCSLIHNDATETAELDLSSHHVVGIGAAAHWNDLSVVCFPDDYRERG